jgi:hypothetical protein
MDFGSMLNKLKRDAMVVAHDTNAVHSRTQPPASKRAKQTKDDDTTHQTITLSNQPPHTKSFPQTKVSKIYLISPSNVRTGGPEAMHQLCNQINSMTQNPSLSAYMLYLEETNGTFQHIRFAKPLKAYSTIYPNLKVASETWDQEQEKVKVGVHDDQPHVPNQEYYYNDSLLIWPEVWTHLIDTCQGKFQHAIWWLSVNNNNGKFTQWERQDILHLYQSEYAKQYILQHLNTIGNDGQQEHQQARVLRMTEYIPTRIALDHHHDVQRDLQVLYNPLKGMHYTDEIRKRSDKKITFTPIGGGPNGRELISYEQVKTMLHRAKIYLDFGPHPGMDRLPREAALANCIVITNREGAAGFENDVPIPEDYKIGDFDVQRIHKLLMECIQSYEEKKLDFDTYREWIASQEDQMKICVSELIDVLVTKRVIDKKS